VKGERCTRRAGVQGGKEKGEVRVNYGGINNVNVFDY
jgi:hypothetical protein